MNPDVTLAEPAEGSAALIDVTFDAMELLVLAGLEELVDTPLVEAVVEHGGVSGAFGGLLKHSQFKLIYYNHTNSI